MQAEINSGQDALNLACVEDFAAHRAFAVEKDTDACIEVIDFVITHNNESASHLGHRIRASRLKVVGIAAA